jgi:hypothetical protein
MSNAMRHLIARLQCHFRNDCVCESYQHASKLIPMHRFALVWRQRLPKATKPSPEWVILDHGREIRTGAGEYDLDMPATRAARRKLTCGSNSLCPLRAKADMQEPMGHCALAKTPCACLAALAYAALASSIVPKHPRYLLRPFTLNFRGDIIVAPARTRHLPPKHAGPGTVC